ncbi:hypothetical protein [uncultured Jatrophihabitans sp.]|uniref:hypothetical protein n=1 Tax=uncultured Jatrophihabitans sp. TaxID=1610747 RepID=UPI0035CBA8DE
MPDVEPTGRPGLRRAVGPLLVFLLVGLTAIGVDLLVQPGRPHVDCAVGPQVWSIGGVDDPPQGRAALARGEGAGRRRRPAARAFGKTTARAFDALIAATAIANGLPVYTCNPRDFEGITGLTVVAIPHPPDVA